MNAYFEYVKTFRDAGYSFHIFSLCPGNVRSWGVFIVCVPFFSTEKRSIDMTINLSQYKENGLCTSRKKETKLVLLIAVLIMWFVSNKWRKYSDKLYGNSCDSEKLREKKTEKDKVKTTRDSLLSAID